MSKAVVATQLLVLLGEGCLEGLRIGSHKSQRRSQWTGDWEDSATNKQAQRAPERRSSFSRDKTQPNDR